MDVTTLPQLARNTGRFREVIAILAKYGLARWMSRVHIEWVQRLFQDSEGQPISELSTEQRIRHALLELGTTYIKLGQILSTRPDLVGPKLTAELTHLQANTPADDSDAVQKLIASELGQTVDEIFSEFGKTAFASASIGQVHAAKLKDGTAVVLKIQHAGIEDRIRNDLEIMHWIAELAEQYSPELSQYRPVETTEEFSRALLAELDFTREQRNLQTFLRNLSGRDDVTFPRPFVELSSRRVLTMERLDGISVADCEALKRSTFDLTEVAHRGANLFLDMIFRDGFYHADPHPGNLMLLPGGVLGLLDGGMVGRIDEQLREQVEDMLLAAVRQDAASMCDVIIRIGSLPPNLDDVRMRSEIEGFLADYSTQSLADFNLTGALNDITGIIRRYGIVLPARMSLLIKVLVMLEGTSRNLDPDFSLAELLQPYQAKAFRRRLSPGRVWNKLQRAWTDWTRLGETLPRDIADLLNQIKRGRFDVHLEHRRLEQTVNRLVMGILSAALFIGSALLWSRNVAPQLWGISVPGAIGWLLALILGYRLVKAIKHSGNIE